MKFDFEKLHSNHKFAFLDGVLTGVAVALIGVAIYQDYKKNPYLYEGLKFTKKTTV